jgi:transcriptional regulator with XRE-family HTH domain
VVQLVQVVRTIEVDAPNLGEQIKEARISAQRNGKSLTKIAAEAEMSVQNWYRIEQERQKLPEETLLLIEKALGVNFGISFDKFLDRDPPGRE